MILALDIARVTGFAFGAPGAPVPLFGHHMMTVPGASEDAVFDAFDSWLDRKLGLLQPRLVIAEEAYPGFEARRLYGLRAICALQCRRHRVPLRRISADRVYRFFTGRSSSRGRDKKADTIAMCRHYGWHVENDDQADALAAWAWAEHEVAPHLARTAGPIFARAG